jgi:hypothetical protein
MQSKKLSNSDIAVSMAEEAIRPANGWSQFLKGFLNKFGFIIGSRYERTGEMSNLEQGIEAARKAADSTPLDHPDRATCLNNLWNMLESPYDRTGDMSDLEQGIEAARQPVDCTPLDHPDAVQE